MQKCKIIKLGTKDICTVQVRGMFQGCLLNKPLITLSCCRTLEWNVVSNPTKPHLCGFSCSKLFSTMAVATTHRKNVGLHHLDNSAGAGLSLSRPKNSELVDPNSQEFDGFLKTLLDNLVESLVKLVPILPLKFWLIFGFCSLTVGCYLVYKIFSWQSQSTFIGLFIVSLLLWFTLKIYTAKTLMHIESERINTNHSLQRGEQEKQINIAQIIADFKKKELQTGLEKDKVRCDAEIFKIETDGKLEEKKIKMQYK